MPPFASSPDRARPRLIDPDYLHLRAISRRLRPRLAAWTGGGRVLDLGAGRSPYLAWLGDAAARAVRLDARRDFAPTVQGRGEALPFRDGAFALILCTQVLPFAADPRTLLAEAARVLAPGGFLLLTTPLHWPRDSAEPEWRFDSRGLASLCAGLRVVEVVEEGGWLCLPFALCNLVTRELVIAAERRLGVLAWPLVPLARALFAIQNLAGAGVEWLAAIPVLRPFLGYLDRRLPMNLLLVAEKPA